MYPGRCSVSTCLTSDGWRRCEPLALTHRYLSACRTCLQYWASPILIKLLPLKDYKYMIFFFLPLAVHALCSEGSFLFFFFAVSCYVFCIMIFFFFGCFVCFLCTCVCLGEQANQQTSCCSCLFPPTPPQPHCSPFSPTRSTSSISTLCSPATLPLRPH